MSTASPLSRRSWLKGLAALVASGTFHDLRLAARAFAQEEASPRETGPLTVRVSRPFDAETPVGELNTFLTPTHRFFVRSHFGPPPSEHLADDRWRLHVGGLVERATGFSMADLRRFSPVSLTAVLQCSGNGRAHHRPRVPGVQWDRGAVGNAQWTGVRLREILETAGVKPEAQHVRFQGADRPVVDRVPLFTRSIPLAKAAHPDTILAYEMNGHPLPLLHGAPLRLITPGWMAESCIKWLTDIVVQDGEADGYYMQQAYRTPVRPVQPSDQLDGVPTTTVDRMVVKSLITRPAEGESLARGPVTIQGVAWSGEAKVVAIEVSFDEGVTWEPARFVGEGHPYAWRQWQYVWNPKQTGSRSILCRATDERGETQPARSPWNPGGFLWNGWDRVTVTVAGT
ncbi:MAG TPA: sulfite oxidase [Nitrospira sp.]|nr:sulfite oxidase [Nitrospira sp.]